jgi:hypothetical protein
MYFVRKLYKEEKRPSGNAKKEAARTKTEVHNMYPGRSAIDNYRDAQKKLDVTE